VIRINPYKATFDLDRHMARAVRSWAGGRCLAVAPVVRVLLGELAADPVTARKVATVVATTGPRAPRGPGMVKTTFDLDPDLYAALKTWAADHDTTGAAVIRALLQLLLDDARLAARVERRATQTP
jgi:hypothetical protein